MELYEYYRLKFIDETVSFFLLDDPVFGSIQLVYVFKHEYNTLQDNVNSFSSMILNSATRRIADWISANERMLKAFNYKDLDDQATIVGDLSTATRSSD